MKPDGKPDAGDRHVRFDERGEETERCRMAQAYRASPRLYSLHPGFCNGPWLVNPFLRHPLAGHLLLYGIGAEAVTSWGALEEPAGQSTGGVVVSRLPGWRPDRIHRPGEGTSLGESLVSWPAQNPIDTPCLGCRGLGRGVERFCVSEHAMQDNGELTRQRHLGLAHASALGDPHRPAL